MNRPLSAFEHIGWLAEQLLCLNFVMVAHLMEPLNEAVLRQALNLIQNRHPPLKCKIIKEIIVQNNVISINVMGTLLNGSNKKDSIQQISKDLNIGIDIPFFFNGNPKEFKWESNQVDDNEIASNRFIDNFQYKGNHFKAYDKTYDFSLEINVDSDLEPHIAKFPIVTNTYTDEGFQYIFQGINTILIFKLRENFTINLELKIN